MAQRAAQRPRGRQPLRTQLEHYFIERAEMRGVTAAILVVLLLLRFLVVERRLVAKNREKEIKTTSS